MPRPVPAWSLPAGEAPLVEAPAGWRESVTREWAIAGSRGDVDVCVVDSGIELGHPLIGPVESAVAVVRGAGDDTEIVPDELGDVCGHGTACAGIIRSIAPDCRLHSVRVLGAGATGAGELILAGLRHAIDAGHRVISLSLSTTKRRFAEELHELADAAYFNRTVLVRRLGREPRGHGSARLVREPVAAGGGVRPWRRRRGGMARRRNAPLHGQQLRGPAHRRRRGARAGQASGADSVPTEDGAALDGRERGSSSMSDGSSVIGAGRASGRFRDCRDAGSAPADSASAGQA
jgi:Subtilase family